ncbi:hypothetical protein BDC45DRAFT_607626 [Circinella umbellata]|nr:hypothetical protein BDC45DRAFT_607626 [Circinella umbellata]
MSQVCSNCLQTRDIIHFQEPTRSYKTCDKCRTNRKRRRTHSSTSDVQQQTNELIPTINSNNNSNNTNTNDISGSSSMSNSDNKNNKNNTIPLVTLENLNENFAALTMHQVEGYDYEARISLNDTLLGLNDMDIAKLLCHKLGECDTYKYILKTVNPSTARKGVASFYANCSQSMALAKSKSNNDTTSPDQQQQRRRNSKQRKRFDCKGRVSASIDRIARQAHVIIQHDIRHEPPEPSRKTPNEVRALIQRETIITGRSAKDIHADVRQQFPNLNITPAQVYYWWREFKQEVAEMSSTITNMDTISSSTVDNNNNNNTVVDLITKRPKTCE